MILPELLPYAELLVDRRRESRSLGSALVLMGPHACKEPEARAAHHLALLLAEAGKGREGQGELPAPASTSAADTAGVAECSM